MTVYNTTMYSRVSFHVFFLLLAEGIRNSDLLHAQEGSKLQPGLIGAQLHLDSEVSAPSGEPGKEVSRPEEAALCLDLFEALLVDGA